MTRVHDMNKRLVGLTDRTFYPSFEDRWDDKLLREEILQYLKPDHTLLDVGAGRGRVKEMDFQGKAAWIDGIDPDPRVETNPLLDKGYVGLADHMPFFEDERFDVVISDNVLEHVEHPDRFFTEVGRVMKKGGILIIKTPNKYHYVPVLARMTPTSFHKFINKIRGRDESDTFPTFYRANTRRAQRKWVNQCGLEVQSFRLVEGRPEYLRITFVTYWIGVLYERIVNTLGLKELRAVLITIMVKK